MNILAIETSCDETSAAVLEVKRGIFNLKSHIVSSQVKIHAKYGGIVPEVAARKQMEMVLPIIQKALVDAGLKSKNIKSNNSNKMAPRRTSGSQHGTSLQNIDYIAVTQGPGLITSLTVGVETAKTLAYTLNKPLIPVNHLVGHLLVNYLNQPGELPKPSLRYLKLGLGFPAIGLVVSGGHTMLVYIKNEVNYKIIGQTVDDAAGEAFDKVAKILGLGYPGGPIISKLAENGNPHAFNLPRPMINQDNLNFSFSGLKTAVLYTLKHKSTKTQKHKSTKQDICASFQQAVIDVLVSKTLRAIKEYKPKSFLLGGGVAANAELRRQLQEKIEKLNAYRRVINHPLTPSFKRRGSQPACSHFPNNSTSSLKRKGAGKINIFIPELKFTGDNAAMIAAAAYFKITKSTEALKHPSVTLRAGLNTLNLKAEPNLKL